MSERMSVKVSGRYQVSLPSHARRLLDIEAGDRLLVDVQDGMLILIPQPGDYSRYLSGLHGEIWRDVDTAAYLNEERAAWQSSDDS